ncbi:MAG: type II toxin-antitoxin system VapC family toxin [Thermoflexales bacterium]|nr:type II toxin-antitoxin system VapC family toxin [Thermoflexales bacterium]
MILYADTSALVKLFVAEEGSDATHDLFRQASLLGTSVLARAELEAALARAVRRGLIRDEDGLDARRRLEIVWPTWVRIAVDERLVARAGALAWEYGLRGYDAVHLAAALVWQERIGYPVVVATFDSELGEAARQASLEVWPAAGLK